MIFSRTVAKLIPELKKAVNSKIATQVVPSHGPVSCDISRVRSDEKNSTEKFYEYHPVDEKGKIIVYPAAIDKKLESLRKELKEAEKSNGKTTELPAVAETVEEITTSGDDGESVGAEGGSPGAQDTGEDEEQQEQSSL